MLIQTTLTDQTSKALFQQHKTLHKFKNVPVSLTLDLFDKFISPILNYASEVWGFHSAPGIERIHRTSCKNILEVKKTTQNDFVYGLLGRHPLQIDRYCKIMKYWLKLCPERSLFMSTLCTMHQNYVPISIAPITGQARLKKIAIWKWIQGCVGKSSCMYMIQTHLCMYSDSD